MPRHSNPPRVRADPAFAILLLLLSPTLLAQPLLRITSSPDRTVVHPGDTLKFTVETPSELIFEAVGLLATSPIDENIVSRTAPYEPSLTIPRRIRPGEYNVTAFGLLRPGQKSGFEKALGRGVPSLPITLIVERADEPVRLEVYPPTIRLPPGHKGFLSVTGIFADGEKVDLKEASTTIYSTDTPRVATVDPKSVVNTLAPGSGKITVSNGKAKVEVPVVVSNTK